MPIISRVITICFIVATLIFAADAPYAQEDHRFRVGLSVTADERTKKEIVSYISRELRALGDVVITDYQEEYKIDVIAMTNELRSGHVSGYTLSFIISRPFYKNKIFDKLKEEYQNDYSLEVLDDLSQILNSGVVAFPPEKLALNCQSFVADFDTTFLNNVRRTRESMRELRGNYNKKLEVLKSIFEKQEAEDKND